MAKSNDVKRITIVGGGLSGIDFLSSLREAVEKNFALLPLEIEIIESGGKFATGLAWDDENARPFHLINNYGNSSGIERLFKKDGGSGNIAKSRGEEGKEYQKRFQDEVMILRGLGAKITLTSHTTVTDIQKRDNGYAVITDNGTEKPSDFVVLASGHWQGKSDKPQNEGVYASPWPASRIEQIDSNQSIAVIGSSLSAVDTILTLAHEAGSFQPNSPAEVPLANGGGILLRKASTYRQTLSLPGDTTMRPPAHSAVIFRPKAKARNFKVIVYSRHGMLPSVLANQKVTPHDFPSVKEFADEEGIVTLDKLYDWLRKDFLERFGNSSLMDVGMRNFVTALKKNTKIEGAIKEFYRLSRQESDGDRLRRQLHEAEKTFDNHTILPWQQYLRYMSAGIESAFNHFSAEDQERFLRDVKPVIAKLAYGMMHTNAQEILALMESGRLEVRELGEYSSIGTKQEDGRKLPGAEIRYKDAKGIEHADYYPAVIKATGDDLYRLQTSSPLMKNIFASGLVQEIFVPYRDQKKGAIEFRREAQQAGEVKNTRFIDGLYFRSGGGIAVKPRTFEPEHLGGADLSKSQNLFIVGPPTYGHFPLLHGTTPINRACEHIIDTMAGRILEGREKVIAPEGILAFGVMDGKCFVAINTPVDDGKKADIKAKLGKLGVTATDYEFVPSSSLPPQIREALEQGRQQEL